MEFFKEMPDHSRVFIYQSTNPISSETVEKINAEIKAFVKGWATHGKSLSAGAEVLYNRFIVLAVDEATNAVSGCSIDSSVHFIQNIERKYSLQLFDHLNFAWKSEKNVLSAGKDDFKQAFQNGDIKEDTLVFNNLVKTLGEMRSDKWILPLKESWHKRFV